MTKIARFFYSVAEWLDKHFPARMTTRDVMAKFVEYETRLAMLERKEEITALRTDIAKLKLVAGIAQLTGINGHQQ